MQHTVQRLGGPQGRFGQVRETSPPPGFDPRTVQPVTSRYTDGAIAAHSVLDSTSKLKPSVTKGLKRVSREGTTGLQETHERQRKNKFKMRIIWVRYILF
jgi:hypothetical protein